VLVIILAVGGVGIATKGTFKFGSNTSGTLPSSSNNTTSQNNSASGKTTTTSGTTSVSVSADELLSAYATDNQAAAAKYKNKSVTVSGKMASFDISKFSVTLKGNTDTDYDITCIFSSGDSSKISNLEPDQAITVKGTVGNFAGGTIEITNCTFIS